MIHTVWNNLHYEKYHKNVTFYGSFREKRHCITKSIITNKVAFFKVTTDIRHHSAETVLCISKWFFATFSQLNFWYWKLFVSFHVNRLIDVLNQSWGVRISVAPIFFVYFQRIVCIYDNNCSLCGNGLTEVVRENRFLVIYFEKIIYRKFLCFASK
jgi:hypothetical protein